MTSELSCKELTEVVTDYLEGTMDALERRRFEEHLSLCPACVTYIEQMKETIRHVGISGPVQIPSKLESDILKAFRSWNERK